MAEITYEPWDKSIQRHRDLNRAWWNGHVHDYVDGARSNLAPRTPYERRIHRGTEDVIMNSQRQHEQDAIEAERERESRRKEAEEERKRQKAEQERRDRQYQRILAEKQKIAEETKARYAERIHAIASDKMEGVDSHAMMADATRGGTAVNANTANRPRSYATGRGNRAQRSDFDPLNPRKSYRPQDVQNWPIRIIDKSQIAMPKFPYKFVYQSTASWENALNIGDSLYYAQIKAQMDRDAEKYVVKPNNNVNSWSKLMNKMGKKSDLIVASMFNEFGMLPGCDINNNGDYIFFNNDTTHFAIVSKSLNSVEFYKSEIKPSGFDSNDYSFFKGIVDKDEHIFSMKKGIIIGNVMVLKETELSVNQGIDVSIKKNDSELDVKASANPTIKGEKSMTCYFGVGDDVKKVSIGAQSELSAGINVSLKAGQGEIQGDLLGLVGGSAAWKDDKKEIVVDGIGLTYENGGEHIKVHGIVEIINTPEEKGVEILKYGIIGDNTGLTYKAPVGSLKVGIESNIKSNYEEDRFFINGKGKLGKLLKIDTEASVTYASTNPKLIKASCGIPQ